MRGCERCEDPGLDQHQKDPPQRGSKKQVQEAKDDSNRSQHQNAPAAVNFASDMLRCLH